MIYTNAEITERRSADLPDADGIQMYRAYAIGHHRDILTHAQNRLLQGRVDHPMVDNILDLILATTASRLRLTSWQVNGESPVSIQDGSQVPESEMRAVTSYLGSLWLMNRLPRLQYEIHYAALRDGNSAVSLAWRNGRAHLAREPWWDGETGTYVAYADDGSYEFAVKEWDQRERDGTITRRRTVYEPGLIARWAQSGNGWTEYDDGETPMLRANGQDPMPIPVVHFPNGSGMTESPYGLSDIASLLALQDDLNATQRDISAAALMTAFQRLFFSGVANPNSIKLSPGDASGDASPDARMTAVPAGDMSQLSDVHDYKRQSMAVSSRTPIHVITGNWPSGEALLRADMPIIEKATALGDVAGPQHTMVAHRAIEMANAYGGMNLNDGVPIISVFDPAERIDELTDIRIQQAKADLWRTLADLPREAMLQTGLVDEATADTIVAERQSMFDIVGDANAGGLE